jgi:hypothetical protein
MGSIMKKLILLFALLLASPALAQTAGEVANHAVPIGRGPGAIGFGAASPGAANGVMQSTGTTTDPAFQALATAAQYFAGTATAPPIAPSIIYQAETTTTYGTTTTFDFSTFINTAVTLTGNITTMTLNNVKAGQAGMITFIQDGSGSRTTVWNTNLKFSGALPTLSTAPGAIDVLTYSCRSATFCAASLLTNLHNP